MKFTVSGTLPGLNEYIDACRRNKYEAAKIKSGAEMVIKAEIRKAKLQPVTGPVTISYLWVEPTRKRDKDNIAFAKKFIQDALVSSGILKGDGWEHIAGFTDKFAVDRKNPRVEVTIITEQESSFDTDEFWAAAVGKAKKEMDIKIVEGKSK